ncbi:MAG: C25 family cysteine peptidase [Candidatus Poribacteria bacterium]|nr:C25 family cysteine peptidase [Candidatus Poribacteria bacterium]
MQMSPLKIRTTARLWLPTLFIIFFFCLDLSALPVQNGSAAAAPITSSDQRSRITTRRSTVLPRHVELVSATAQGITIQLLIPESDFRFNSSNTEIETGKVENQTISFSNCRFTTEPGAPRLPVQTTLLAVPADVDFQLRIVEKRFSTRSVERIVYTPAPQGAIQQKRDLFSPDNLAEIREDGWMRENRILAIQLNPVQYNPIRREVRLYHRLVVEVRFIKTLTRGVNASPSAMPSGLRTESAAYNAIFNDLLINPQNVEQWRLPIARVPSAPSVLSTHPQYKISVTESGMYSIAASDLAAAGADVRAIMPRTLKLINKGAQIPLFVRGENDGRFDLTDEIIFYGERQHGETSYIDPFTDENIYWLSWNSGPGSRMVTKTAFTGTSDTQDHKLFLTRAHFEKDNTFRRFRDVNLAEGQTYEEFGAGLQTRSFRLTELPALPDDSWFWAQLTAPASKSFNFTLVGLANTARPATVRVSLHGRSNTGHDCDIWLNDKIRLEEAQWTGETEYQLQNQELPQSFLQDGRNVLQIMNPGSPEALIDIILLNWLQVDYWRNFDAKSDVLPFAITPFPDETGAVNPNFEVILKNFSTPDVEIYGIDGTRYDGLSALVDEDAPGTYRIIFRATQIRPKDEKDPAIQYIALTRNQFRKPKISVDARSDLRSIQNAADYIIITHTDFIHDVQPLADFRSQQGMRTKVVDVQDIYDEFNHGILNPNAIREFLKYAYANWQPPAPTYVLLVGDTHIDIKNNTNFVPTIRVQIPGYGSSASDHQFVTFRGEDNFPDMLIGRMPANNRVDARIFVERTIKHETSSPAGPWHKRLLMLAGSDDTFHSQIDRLISHNQLRNRYETERIYAPYKDELDLSIDESVTTPIARQVIDGFNNGASLINYIGHGGGGIWSDSRMLDFEDPEQNLTNISQLPLVISMTCYTGAFDGTKNSLAEELLRSENGGAIAVIGATSIGLLDGDYILNREIFDVLFKGHTQNIGAIFAQAKTQFLINTPGFLDLTEVFTLFGDPATQLKIPNNQMEVVIDFGSSSTESTFKENLLTVSGILPDRSFSGDAEISVVPTTETGNDIPPEKETVSVVNGRFTTQIQLPTDPEFDTGSVQAYAWNSDADAIGYATYNALSQYVDNVRLTPFPVQPNQPAYLYTSVVNESAIDEMTLFWSWDGREFFAIPVVPHSGTTYRSERPIPGHPDGDIIDYYFEVKLKAGRVLRTETVTYDVGYVEPEVDLVLLEQTITWGTTPPFTLSAQIRNQGTKTARNVTVHFFQKTVDTETENSGTNIAAVPTLSELQNTPPIEGVQIISEIPPDAQITVSVPWEPLPGNYLITVYVDMPSAELPKGSIIERLERNNIGDRQFVGNRIVLTPETPNPSIQSKDGSFRVAIPSESLQTTMVLTYTEAALTITNQPDIVKATPASALAYQLDLSEQTELTATATFLKAGSDDPHIYRRDDNGNWILVGNQETTNEETISAEVKLPGTFALLSHSDTSLPVLELTFEHQGFVDGDYISDTPTISARIEDANGIDSRPAHIILTQNGQRVPEDEYVITASPTNSNLMLITYTPVLEPGEYRIRLQAQDANGNASDATQTATVAGEFEIKNIANFPNPFVPGDGTHFAYYLTKGADKVSLKIYTITGRLILAVDTLDASVSFNEFHYDGYDADGEPLANGVYLYKFTAQFTNAQGNTVRKQKFGKIAVRK